MRVHTLAMLCAVLALAPMVSADTVVLRSGEEIECIVRRVEEDRLVVAVETGEKEYARDEVSYFIMPQRDAEGNVVTGPDGEPVMKKYAFRPKPLKLPFELKTKHYVVKTDISEKVASNIGRAMEHMYKSYASIFRPKDVAKQPVNVIVFKAREDFRQYASDITSRPMEHVLGFYRLGYGPTPGQIVTYRREDGGSHTLKILFHEGSHQFLMMVIGAHNPPPLWLNEGFAVYFESSRWENGKLRTGIIPGERLARLQSAIRAGNHIPLADLLTRGTDTYDSLCYAEGWSLVYFLLKADRGAHRKRMGAFIDAIKAGRDHGEAFKRTITPNIHALEREWKKFVLKLKVPR